MVTVVPSSVRATDSAISRSASGSRVIARRVPVSSTKRPQIARESAWRQYSARIGTSLVSLALSPSVSRIVTRSRIGTASEQQGLEDALHLADGHQVGHQLVHRGREALLEGVEEAAHVLAARAARPRCGG